MDHRLLAVDVLAGLHGVDGGLLVPVVGRGDDDGVNVFARQDLAVVAGGEDVLPPELLAVLESSVVAVGNRDQFHAWNLNGSVGIELALDACADQGDLDVVTGRHRSGRASLWGSQGVHILAQQGPRGYSTRHLKKISTIPLAHD